MSACCDEKLGCIFEGCQVRSVFTSTSPFLDQDWRTVWWGLTDRYTLAAVCKMDL